MPVRTELWHEGEQWGPGKIDPEFIPGHQTTGIPETACPTCGHRLTASTSMEPGDIRPKPGDLTVCFGCGQELQFTEDLGMRALSRRDLDRMVVAGELDQEARDVLALASYQARTK